MFLALRLQKEGIPGLPVRVRMSTIQDSKKENGRLSLSYPSLLSVPIPKSAVEMQILAYVDLGH